VDEEGEKEEEEEKFNHPKCSDSDGHIPARHQLL
jgi:hypothetical protein